MSFLSKLSNVFYPQVVHTAPIEPQTEPSGASVIAATVNIASHVFSATPGVLTVSHKHDKPKGSSKPEKKPPSPPKNPPPKQPRYEPKGYDDGVVIHPDPATSNPPSGCLIM